MVPVSVVPASVTNSLNVVFTPTPCAMIYNDSGPHSDVLTLALQSDAVHAYIIITSRISGNLIAYSLAWVLNCNYLNTKQLFSSFGFNTHEYHIGFQFVLIVCS